MTGSGEAFGKVDDNIKKGMTVEHAVETILKAIYLQKSEVVVSNLFYKILPKIAFMCSCLNDIIGNMAYKRQVAVMVKAQKGE